MSIVLASLLGIDVFAVLLCTVYRTPGKGLTRG
jgi:hypothetical protein